MKKLYFGDNLDNSGKELLHRTKRAEYPDLAVEALTFKKAQKKKKVH